MEKKEEKLIKEVIPPFSLEVSGGKSFRNKFKYFIAYADRTASSPIGLSWFFLVFNYYRWLGVLNCMVTNQIPFIGLKHEQGMLYDNWVLGSYAKFNEYDL